MNGQPDEAVTLDGSGVKTTRPPIVLRTQRHFRRRMLAGLLVLIPLLVTAVVLRFAFVSLDSLFRPYVRDTPLDILDFPGAGVTATLLVLYVVGALVAWEAGRIAVDWQAAILSRIPVVKSIYVVAKQATDALSSPLGQKFSRVVFIEWPRPGFKALGFVTGYTVPADGDGEIQVAVYIPTVPNPTSGNLAFVSAKDIIETTIKVEDAMKTVFSGGIILPKPAALTTWREPPDL